MKICPRCQKTYGDDALNFCLDDGAVLDRAAAPDNSIPPTVAFNQPRPTNQPQQFGGQTNAPNAWSNQNQFQTPSPPPKKSKAWLWVLGILGGLMLLCGGGFAGLIYWGSRLDESNKKDYGRTNYNFNSKPIAPTNRAMPEKTSALKIDLSEWVKGTTDLGVTEYKNGEFLMSSRKKNFYYVLCSKDDEDKTENSITRVTVRNVNQADTTLGFGLVIHSSPVPLTQDYAFLIDSENGKYRVVRHVPKNEITVVGWTYSSDIKNGTSENVLEVRDQNKQMNFYLNGTFVKSVNNTDGYAGGVAGLYAGDAAQIAFTDFEVDR